MKVYRVIFEIIDFGTVLTYSYELFSKNETTAITETEKRWYSKHQQVILRKRAEEINTTVPLSRFQFDIEKTYQIDKKVR